MAGRITNAIRMLGPQDPFERYLMSIYRGNGAGVPSPEEARKDFRRTLLAQLY